MSPSTSPRVAIASGIASYDDAERALRSALELLTKASAQHKPREHLLGDFVRPGNTILLKPNFVREFRESSPDDADCLFTHGLVIRAVLHIAAAALQGCGRLIVADAPQNDGDFDVMVARTGLMGTCKEVRTRYGVPVDVIDLRSETAFKKDGVILGHRRLPGDPAGYVRVDLGPASAFVEIEDRCARLYGAEYDQHELVEHHRDGRHEYLLSRTVLQADCVINLPKLKTHKKTGLTAALKNLVGINGNKNWLPHHREGTPRSGGDQFADERWLRHAERGVMSLFRRVFPLLGPLRPMVAGPIKAAGRSVFGDTNSNTVRSGNWYGNDTTWRMVLDLNRALLFAGVDGVIREKPVRRCLTIVDAVVAGEGNGPLDATPRHAGLLIAGENPVAVDLVCARLMGFDERRLPLIARAFDPHSLQLTGFSAGDVVICSEDPRYDGPVTALTGPQLAFRPHFGWLGHVEQTENPRAQRPVA